MMAVAVGGLLVNLAGLWILNAGKSENLNVRGAWLHVLGDALGSVGVIAAGVAIWMFGWNWADPVASIIIGVLVLYSSWSLLKEAVAVLMEEAPGHLDVDEIRNAIISIQSVIGVEDLHVWTIASGRVSLSAHVAVDEARPGGAMLTEIRQTLHDRFGIDHLTIQLEPEGFEKLQPPCDYREERRPTRA